MNVCIAGTGGFGAAHHQALWDLEREGEVKVVATCDPRIHSLTDLQLKFDFANRGVKVFNDFEAMLDASPCDWVSVATPIGLHAPMHDICVARSLPCYLEKPPTLDPAELERMINVDLSAIRQTQVGFNYVYDPERLALKKRLLKGEFGRLLRVGLRGAWQRTEAYYRRSPWAGRLMMNETLLLDSCMGNAMAHHVHNLLFFAGVRHMSDWGTCQSVEARLFHANHIEGADTVFARGDLADSIEFRIALSHACEETSEMEESLVCEKAVIRIVPNSSITIAYAEGRTELIPFIPRENLKENFHLFNKYVRGEPVTLMSTLVDCRPFVWLNALTYVSAGRIESIVPDLLKRTGKPNPGGGCWQIIGIGKLLEQFVQTGDFAGIQRIGTTRTDAKTSNATHLPKLAEIVASMAADEI